MRYIRKDLQGMIPYSASNYEYKIALNSNESPFDLPNETKTRLIEHIKNGNIFNRYPDPDCTLLRQALAHHCRVDINNILVSSGSDELIQLIINTFVNTGEHVLFPVPSFSMYKIYTQIGGGIPVEVELGENYEYNIAKFIDMGQRYSAKIAFICNPNNPTGNTIDREDIIALIEGFEGIVVIDEAYIEFHGDTAIDLIAKYENVIILRTFSKAFGAAGLRVGYLIASQNLVDDLYITKSPYNINTFSQLTALELLKDWNITEERIDYIIAERERVYNILCTIDSVDVLPSRANFLLIKVQDSQYVYDELLQRGILVRNFSEGDILTNHIRISIASREENDIFLRELSDILKERRYKK